MKELDMLKEYMKFRIDNYMGRKFHYNGIYTWEKYGCIFPTNKDIFISFEEFKIKKL